MDKYQKILTELKAIRDALAAGQKRFLTVDEAAASLGLSPKTVRNKLWDGSFPIKPVRLGGKILFKVRDLDALVDRLGVGDG